MSRTFDAIKKLRQQRYFKIIFLYNLCLFLSFLFWFSLKANFDIVFLGTSGRVGTLLLSFFTMLLFVALFAAFVNSVSLLKQVSFIGILIVLINLPYLLVFGVSLFTIEGFLLLLLGFYIWSKRIQRHNAAYIRYNPLRSGRSGLHLAVTIFLFVIAFSFYLSVAYQGQANFFLTRLEKYTVELTNQSFKIFLPGYRSDMQVNEFLGIVLRNPFWQKFFMADRKQDINTAFVDATQASLEEKLGVSLEGKTANYLVEKIVHGYITNTLMRYQNLFSGATALAFFLFLKVFSLAYYLLIQWLSWVWFKIFLGLKVAVLSKECIEVERIGL